MLHILTTVMIMVDNKAASDMDDEGSHDRVVVAGGETRSGEPERRITWPYTAQRGQPGQEGIP